MKQPLRCLICYAALAALVLPAVQCNLTKPVAPAPPVLPAPPPAGFALIPAGEFTMGDALDGDENALPHRVNVSAFYLQKKEVSGAQWTAVRAWGLQHGYRDLPNAGGKEANHPVHTLSWYAAVKWSNAKSEKEGLTPCYYTDAAQTKPYRNGEADLSNTMVKWSANGYRLPTEAEWEKAARGGLNGKRYPQGNTISHAQVNYMQTGGESYKTGTPRFQPAFHTGGTPYTSPGGSFAANGYGLYDMAGNVWEWCWDWFEPYPATLQTDPRGPESGLGEDPRRALRGGAWDGDADACRVASRMGFVPYVVRDGHSSAYLGFRLARSPAQPNLTEPVPPAPPLATKAALVPLVSPHLKAAVRADFALIPAGEFTMGDVSDGEAWLKPRQVTVSALYMQRKEVSKAQWDEVRAWGLRHGYADLAEGTGKAADHPVLMVSWYDAVKWCNARSEKEGLTPCYFTDAKHKAVLKTGTAPIYNTMVDWRTANGYRLPTEAEWEKAARGGLVGKRFPWGDTISHQEANFDNSGNETYQTGTTGYHPAHKTGEAPFTSPGGSFAPNGYGLYDMAGNAWEWCWDCGNSNSAALTTDPHGSAGPNRVLRGGTCGTRANSCRVASRTDSSPGNTYYGPGFRTVRR
ncbi:MAG: SUMF1/EgtB/PvdO family nonheme iron enzyme [Verrucomicrobia bacterium]|nr:SUMF1/EgtB/PvdO family nonheme iron enzyme [Verrucomicrobiota bacterium]